MIDFSKIKIGDRIVRTKGGIFSAHHGVYAGIWNNQHLIAENQSGYGVRYSNFNQFLNGGKIIRIEHNNFNSFAQSEVIKKINQRLGKSYSLVSYNCEHFANEVISGMRNSNQVNTAALLIGFGALLMYALKE